MERELTEELTWDNALHHINELISYYPEELESERAGIKEIKENLDYTEAQAALELYGYYDALVARVKVLTGKELQAFNISTGKHVKKKEKSSSNVNVEFSLPTMTKPRFSFTDDVEPEQTIKEQKQILLNKLKSPLPAASNFMSRAKNAYDTALVDEIIEKSMKLYKLETVIPQEEYAILVSKIEDVKEEPVKTGYDRESTDDVFENILKDLSKFK